MNYRVHRNDLVYPEFSFEVNGALFDVFNQIGGSHPEKTIQKAVAIMLAKRELRFVEQHYIPVKIEDKIVGKYFLDFLVKNKNEEIIILELKRGRYYPKNLYQQMEQYLKVINLPLAIVGCFANDCVVIKRIINHDYRIS